MRSDSVWVVAQIFIAPACQSTVRTSLADRLPASPHRPQIMMSKCLPGHRPGDPGHVVGQHAPADPAAHPYPPLIAATVQLKAAAQHADPPLNPRPKPKAAPPPAGPYLSRSMVHALCYGAPSHNSQSS